MELMLKHMLKSMGSTLNALKIPLISQHGFELVHISYLGVPWYRGQLRFDLFKDNQICIFVRLVSITPSKCPPSHRETPDVLPFSPFSFSFHRLLPPLPVALSLSFPSFLFSILSLIPLSYYFLPFSFHL